jgi:uncharacterized membrane protein YeaQ/YmgE (transglycosylase-associated protein family)
LFALLVGAIAVFLAGQIVKGHDFGLIGNIVVGILGAGLFGLLFRSLNLLYAAILNEIVGSTLGVILLLLVIGLFKKGP